MPASLIGLVLVALLWAPRPTTLLRERAFAQNRAEYQQAVVRLDQIALRTDSKRANYALLPANLQHLSACGGGIHLTTAPVARAFFYSSSDRFHTAGYLYTADGRQSMPGSLSQVGGWRCSPLAEPRWFLCVFAT